MTDAEIRTAGSPAADAGVQRRRAAQLRDELADGPGAGWRSIATRCCAPRPSWTTSASAPRAMSSRRTALRWRRFAQELLPVRDSLELAVANAAKADAASLAAGQEATLKLLARGLRAVRDPGARPAGRAFRSAAPRGHGDAGSRRRRTGFGAAGGAAGLRAQWPAAAPGARHRGARRPKALEPTGTRSQIRASSSPLSGNFSG